jgi:YidC/Oxa1 family membrane protein insertase
MEYERLRAIGHDFDDVNPYGWAWMRPIIRPVAVGARWLLVWMHDRLGFAYGVGLIAFGVLIRILLWPLNQKAMRSSMAMQAVQPLMKELQEKHKQDPQRLQQEMFKLYKEHNVNPLGGCWPMLLPWPILFALFFVFQNTIELRGATFLWIPDLSRPDPIYVIPILMGASMYVLTKMGQLGMEPNPQMKVMLYMMPAMMTFLFLNFASGLNLYYTVMNVASLPQQWMLAKERMRRNPPAPGPKKKA